MLSIYVTRSVRWKKAADGARAAPDSRVDTGSAAPRPARPAPPLAAALPARALPARMRTYHRLAPRMTSTPSVLQPTAPPPPATTTHACEQLSLGYTYIAYWYFLWLDRVVSIVRLVQ